MVSMEICWNANTRNILEDIREIEHLIDIKNIKLKGVAREFCISVYVTLIAIIDAYHNT